MQSYSWNKGKRRRRVQNKIIQIKISIIQLRINIINKTLLLSNTVHKHTLNLLSHKSHLSKSPSIHKKTINRYLNMSKRYDVNISNSQTRQANIDSSFNVKPKTILTTYRICQQRRKMTNHESYKKIE